MKKWEKEIRVLLKKINPKYPLRYTAIEDLKKIGVEILQPNEKVVAINGICFNVHSKRKTIDMLDPQGHVYGVFDSNGCCYHGTRSQCEDWQNLWGSDDYPTEVSRDYLWG